MVDDLAQGACLQEGSPAAQASSRGAGALGSLSCDAPAGNARQGAQAGLGLGRSASSDG